LDAGGALPVTRNLSAKFEIQPRMNPEQRGFKGESAGIFVYPWSRFSETPQTEARRKTSNWELRIQELFFRKNRLCYDFGLLKAVRRAASMASCPSALGWASSDSPPGSSPQGDHPADRHLGFVRRKIAARIPTGVPNRAFCVRWVAVSGCSAKLPGAPPISRSSLRCRWTPHAPVARDGGGMAPILRSHS